MLAQEPFLIGIIRDCEIIEHHPTGNISQEYFNDLSNSLSISLGSASSIQVPFASQTLKLKGLTLKPLERGITDQAWWLNQLAAVDPCARSQAWI
jgi:hypothetical protein